MALVSNLMRDFPGQARSMRTAEAISALEKAEIGVSPLVPLLALMGRREEITPRLLQEIGLSPSQIEQRDRSENSPQFSNWMHITALYLLAHFKEPRAYQPLVRFLAEDSLLAMELLDDIVTEDLSALLARTYDGSDLAPLKAIIEDNTAACYVRDACIKAMHGMALLGKLERADVVAYFTRMLDELRDEVNIDLADCIVLAAAGLREPALLPKIARWFEDDLVDSMFLSAEDIKNEYESPLEDIEQEVLRTDHFNDLAEYLSSWSWFSESDPDEIGGDELDDLEDLDDLDLDALEAVLDRIRRRDFPEALQLEATYVRTQPKVGRNEPCPCGSGKKYKKCCLN